MKSNQSINRGDPIRSTITTCVLLLCLNTIIVCPSRKAQCTYRYHELRDQIWWKCEERKKKKSDGQQKVHSHSSPSSSFFLTGTFPWSDLFHPSLGWKCISAKLFYDYVDISLKKKGQESKQQGIKENKNKCLWEGIQAMHSGKHQSESHNIHQGR